MVKKFENVYKRFERKPTCDRQTHRLADRRLATA